TQKGSVCSTRLVLSSLLTTVCTVSAVGKTLTPGTTTPMCHTVFLHGTPTNSLQVLTTTVCQLLRSPRGMGVRRSILFCVLISILSVRRQQEAQTTHNHLQSNRHV